MSSTALPTPDSATADGPPFVSGHTPELKGQRAECDGGRPVAGTKYAGRQEFTGTLTGDYRDFGPYPWRWYLLGELTRKPPGFAYDSVWCDADSLTLIDENGRPLDVTLA